MKLKDIKKAVIDKLTASFPEFDVFGENKSSEANKSKFIVELNPIYMGVESSYHRRQYVNITIRIHTQNKTNDEYIDVVDKLYKIIDATIKVNDRELYINKIRMIKENDILKCSFNINYEDEIERNENYELMKELNFKEEY
ncbi:hypothetical protein PV797_05400 [Clostridiaceae bacterium M8S5]|nr:hypothetical protein PV797_05400 [Clostridiaceae bacterium M8S5]